MSPDMIEKKLKPLTPTAVKVDEFTPVYMQNVMEVNQLGNGVPAFQRINPLYCLTLESASKLVDVLFSKLGLTARIVMSSPLHWAPSSPFTTNLQVPWLVIKSEKLPQGIQMNAGLMAIPFLNNSFSIALQQVTADIRNMENFLIAEGYDQVGVE